MSPQSRALYQILLDTGNPLSTKEIAAKLKISPSLTYRLTNPLLSIGLITKTPTYPYKFMAKPIDEGLSLFLLYQNEWFTNQFSSSDKKGLSFSFIQSRDALMIQSAKEINQATKSVDLLRSGGELSTDVILATIEAKKRGVLTRMLIQDYSKDNEQQVSYWQRNGILVRKSALKHMRLMIYDSSSVYFMSYRNTDSKKDLGMKINYPPFAAILSKVFEEWWQQAEII